ncbi:MAG: hypothetical protein NXI32_09235 [bacterium]|nr:hypothetical protein [bacterium]
MIALLLLLGLGSPIHGAKIVQHRADKLELNHYLTEDGQTSFDQLIFWEWSPEYCRFHVVAWCLVDNAPERAVRKLPDGRYQCRWWDEDREFWHVVTSKLYRETWTTVDPERANKILFEEKHRRRLWPVSDEDEG